MILGFPRAKQGLCRTKHGGAGGIILWALLPVFLVSFIFHLLIYVFDYLSIFSFISFFLVSLFKNYITGVKVKNFYFEPNLFKYIP